jgi:hypothetical protein
VLRIIILTLRRKEINSEKLLRVRRLYKWEERYIM